MFDTSPPWPRNETLQWKVFVRTSNKNTLYIIIIVVVVVLVVVGGGGGGVLAVALVLEDKDEDE